MDTERIDSSVLGGQDSETPRSPSPEEINRVSSSYSHGNISGRDSHGCGSSLKVPYEVWPRSLRNEPVEIPLHIKPNEDPRSNPPSDPRNPAMAARLPPPSAKISAAAESAQIAHTHEEFAECVQGHGVCSDCVRRLSEELIGQMKNHVRCLNPECTAEYSLATLRRVLSKSVYVRLEKKRQAEDIIAAGIEGLESCPFCEYCEVPNDADRLFRCKNLDRVKVSCRQCRESDHSPLRCEEYAVRVRLQSYVETKMTDMLLRECPACKRKFVKADGCNEMACVCNAVMCFICRNQIKDSSHFSPLPPVEAAPVPGNPYSVKCPLHSDTEKMREEEVARSAAVARAELIAQNPDIRVDLVLGKSKALQSK